MKTGRLIVFEGIDGAGKSSLIQGVAEHLSKQGIASTTITRFMLPELTSLWGQIVADDLVDPVSAATIAIADYFVGLERVIKPAIERGVTVLADRYYYSHIAFFHARGIDLHWLQACFRTALTPDIVFFIDISIPQALERLRPKNKPDFWEAGLDYRLNMRIGQAYAYYQQNPLEKARIEEYFSEHQQRIVTTYKQILPQSTYWLDGSKTHEALAQECRQILTEFLKPVMILSREHT
ncbi:MAG: thymidylate kinase [Herpetosiphonaceae bacterium]|nr:MAG: thymidylate kinase [Herpetosiphonaceae bacterium]